LLAPSAGRYSRNGVSVKLFVLGQGAAVADPGGSEQVEIVGLGGLDAHRKLPAVAVEALVSPAPAV
jgi:hypothetical protein